MQTQPANPSCINCEYYAAVNSHYGKCRRFPPTQATEDDEPVQPITTPTDWCGEYHENTFWTFAAVNSGGGNSCEKRDNGDHEIK